MKSALFIDDDVDYLYIIERYKDRGKIPNLSDVITAENGKEAIEYLVNHLKSKVPNAIFVDINMPVMDGHEFLEKFQILREQHEELRHVLPIAVITSSTSDQDKNKINQMDFVSQYLVKDIGTPDLVKKINEMLA